MIRSSIILLTALSMLLGSFGSPEILHACLMEQSVTVNASCAGCRDMDATTSDNSGASNKSFSAQQCCVNTTAVRYLDAATFDGHPTEFSLPHLAAFPAYEGRGAEIQLIDSHVERSIDPSPPGLAQRGRHTYLAISVFLI